MLSVLKQNCKGSDVILIMLNVFYNQRVWIVKNFQISIIIVQMLFKTNCIISYILIFYAKLLICNTGLCYFVVLFSNHKTFKYLLFFFCKCLNKSVFHCSASQLCCVSFLSDFYPQYEGVTENF